MNVVLALIVMIMQRVQTCLEVITAHAKRDLLGTIHIVKVPEIIKPLSNISILKRWSRFLSMRK